MNEAKELARAMRDHTLRAHHALSPKLRKAVIRVTDPLKVEMLTSPIVLDGDQLLLGSWLRYYDRTYGLEVGDTLYLMPLDDGSWLAIEADTDADFDEEGLSRTSADLAITTDDGDIVGSVPFYDKTGALVGVAVLFDPETLS